MSNTGKNVVGVDNTFRRKFDGKEYEERAKEREKQEEEEEGGSKPKDKDKDKDKAKGPLAPLKQRDYEVDLESRLGKSKTVSPQSQHAGFYCKLCECVVKDSARYTEHINGKKHQSALGMCMRVERSSVKQVQERFEIHKKRKNLGSDAEREHDERILKQQQEKEERKRMRREKKKEREKEAEAEAVEEPETETETDDPDVASVMGFSGFRSSKK